MMAEMLDGGERRCSLSWYNTQVCCDAVVWVEK